MTRAVNRATLSIGDHAFAESSTAEYTRDVPRHSRIARRALLVAFTSLGVMYVGDWLWVRSTTIHGQGGEAFGNVTFYYATRLKNNRVEVFYDRPEVEVCVHSLFPHFGRRPCWYARRQTVRVVRFFPEYLPVSLPPGPQPQARRLSTTS